MRAISIFLASLAILSGCSRGDKRFQGYQSGSGDLAAFAIDEAARVGAQPRASGSLPRCDAEWRYKSDKDGIQIYALGDRTAQVAAFLSAAFGQPAFSKTNEHGRVTAGVYAAPAVGAAIQFGQEDMPASGMCTTVVIVRQGALNP